MRRIKELTPAQTELLKLMKEKDYRIVHNEGANFKVWLETADGQRVTDKKVRKDTADYLHSKGYIENYEVEGYYIRNFYHKLSEKAKRRLSWLTA